MLGGAKMVGNISDEISQIEQEIKTGQNTVTINPEIKYVQIFPCNLSDICFEIQHSRMPKFISKIPGQAQHLIGKITYKSQKTSVMKHWAILSRMALLIFFPAVVS